MSKVIESRDRFEMKALLDTASQNLTTIADALTSAQSVVHDQPENALRMVEHFAKGVIKPFYEPLDDSTLLYDLMNTQSDLYGQLMSITLRYGNRDCHLLTVALAQFQQVPGLQVLKVVDQTGAPIHSGLSVKDSSLFLDANGVHTQADVLAHWMRRCGGPVFLRLTSTEQMAGLGNFSQVDLQRALGEFGFTAAYMLDNLEALAEIPDFDMDDDLDDDDFSL